MSFRVTKFFNVYPASFNACIRNSALITSFAENQIPFNSPNENPAAFITYFGLNLASFNSPAENPRNFNSYNPTPVSFDVKCEANNRYSFIHNPYSILKSHNL